MADSYLDTAGGMQQVPTLDIVEKQEQPYIATDGSMQSAVAVNVGAGGEIITDGSPVTVKPANDVSSTYQGTFEDGTPPSVTLPANVAMTADGDAVGVWNASDDSRGNGSAFINQGAFTALRLPAQNDVVGNGASVIISKADNTGLLATGIANVPADTNTFESVALPQNCAIIQDGVGSIDILDYGSGGGQVAGIARVSANAGNVQLANSTTKVAINAAPAQVTGGSKTVGITLAVDQGAWQPFPLSTATDAIVSNADPVTVKNSGGTTLGTGTVVVAANAVTQITADISSGPADGSAISIANSTGSISVNGTYHTAGPSASLPTSADIVQSNEHVMVQNLSGGVSTTTATIEFLNDVFTGVTLPAEMALTADGGQVTVPVDGVNKIVTITVTDGAIASITTADP